MTRGQVIEALKRCTQDPSAGTCAGCPYEKVGDTFKECCMALMFDCLEVLEAQKPRVLSWDEVYANTRPFVVWYESRYGDEAEPLAFVDGEYVNSECTLYVEMNFANQRDYMADLNDGFRFWTAEPSFEQMEMTPWQGSSNL